MAEKFNLDNLLIDARNNLGISLTDNDFLSNTIFHNQIVDQIDGKVILRSQLSVLTDSGIVAFSKIRKQEQIDFQVIQGQAIIQTDPYNGETLITPIGDTPVKVRPVLESVLQDNPIRIIGEEQEIGIDIRKVPIGERFFDRAGGGACASDARLGGAPIQFELRVRAFMPTNVIPLSLTRRRLNWNHALYFAYHPEIGLIRIRYNPDLQSYTYLESHADEKIISETGFFPARGQNNLYFIIEMMNLGVSCFNKKPMIQSYENTYFPPYSTPLTIDEPVEFFNTENPDLLMMTIFKNDMQIYDYSSIEVECLNYKINEDGSLNSHWRFVNQSSEQIATRWFALGNFESYKDQPSEGTRILGPANSGSHEFEVDFVGQLRKSSLSQFVTMNIVSLDDPVLMGTQRLDFKFPDPNNSNPST